MKFIFLANEIKSFYTLWQTFENFLYDKKNSNLCFLVFDNEYQDCFHLAGEFRGFISGILENFILYDSGILVIPMMPDATSRLEVRPLKSRNPSFSLRLTFSLRLRIFLRLTFPTHFPEPRYNLWIPPSRCLMKFYIGKYKGFELQTPPMGPRTGSKKIPSLRQVSGQ